MEQYEEPSGRGRGWQPPNPRRCHNLDGVGASGARPPTRISRVDHQKTVTHVPGPFCNHSTRSIPQSPPLLHKERAGERITQNALHLSLPPPESEKAKPFSITTWFVISHIFQPSLVPRKTVLTLAVVLRNPPASDDEGTGGGVVNTKNIFAQKPRNVTMASAQ